MGLEALIPEDEQPARKCPNCQEMTKSTANKRSYACKNDNCRVVLFQTEI